MRKLFMVLLAFLIINAAYIEEGGELAMLIAPTVFLPLILGPFFTTLFSFSFKEIRDAFRDAFSGEVAAARLEAYRIDLLVIKNLASAVLYWSLTIVVYGLILILSRVEDPNDIGPAVAVTFLSLLHGFGLRAILLNPMEHSIHKKILLAEQSAEM